MAVLESSHEIELAAGFTLHRVYRYGGTLVTVVVSFRPASPAAGTEEPR
jgi:hypothetical protein